MRTTFSTPHHHCPLIYRPLQTHLYPNGKKYTIEYLRANYQKKKDEQKNKEDDSTTTTPKRRKYIKKKYDEDPDRAVTHSRRKQ